MQCCVSGRGGGVFLSARLSDDVGLLPTSSHETKDEHLVNDALLILTVNNWTTFKRATIFVSFLEIPLQAPSRVSFLH